MPAPLVECVPNFSEGRDRATLEALERAITSVPGAKLLDVQADAAHHRSVFTFVAPPGAAVEAALRAMRVATERIDRTRHTGEHPRVGATDVVPFVPVRDVTMDDCVALARRLAERAAAELGIPIYLYARAATRPERERLPDIRKGEFEGLSGRIGQDAAADPAFGPRPPSPLPWGASAWARSRDRRLHPVRSARSSPRTRPYGCRATARARDGSPPARTDRSGSPARRRRARRGAGRARRNRPWSRRAPGRTAPRRSRPRGDALPCAASGRCARSPPASRGARLRPPHRGARRR